MNIYTVETDYTSTPYDSLAVATKWFNFNIERIAEGDHLITRVKLVHKYYNTDGIFTIDTLNNSTKPTE